MLQRVDGVDRPIAILSKSLDCTQRNVRFTLQTDHKNLIYINDTASSKVIRWKLPIQEYDFGIEHIAGKDNLIADSFSRFCHFPAKEEEFEYDCDMSEHIMGTLDDFDIPRDKYRIIAASQNTFVGHHGVYRTCKKVVNYLTTGTGT